MSWGDAIMDKGSMGARTGGFSSVLPQAAYQSVMRRNFEGGGPVMSIARQFGPSELAVITGGGGKTSLMFALARELRRVAAVITTTTARIAVPGPEDTETLLLGGDRWDEWRAALSQAGHVTIAESEEGSKLKGFPPAVLDEIYERRVASYVLVEADGAMRLPFKAYEGYEPVIPQSATLHIVVIGMEPFLCPLTEQNTFRLRLFAERRGMKSGVKISHEAIADILDDPGEYLKGGNLKTRRILLVNKCDLADEPLVQAVKDTLRRRLQFYDLLIFASLQKNALYDFAETDRR